MPSLQIQTIRKRHHYRPLPELTHAHVQIHAFRTPSVPTRSRVLPWFGWVRPRIQEVSVRKRYDRTSDLHSLQKPLLEKLRTSDPSLPRGQIQRQQTKRRRVEQCKRWSLPKRIPRYEPTRRLNQSHAEQLPQQLDSKTQSRSLHVQSPARRSR